VVLQARSQSAGDRIAPGRRVTSSVVDAETLATAQDAGAKAPRMSAKDAKRARFNDMRERRLAVLLTLRGLGCRVFENQPVPLAVGIGEQIAALVDGVHTPTDVNIFLRWWTTRPDYLEAVARGEPRRDLDGVIAQEPEPGHREHARQELERRTGRQT